LKKFAKILKYIYQFLCIIALIYQIIELTNNYLSFDFEVKLDIIEENEYYLPSITICIKSSINSNKLKQNLENNTKTINQFFYTTKNLTEILNCFVYSHKYNKQLFKKCKEFGIVLEYISFRDELLKCFTYFNKNHLSNKSTNYKMSKINFIEFKFSPIILYKYLNSQFIYVSINPSNSVFEAVL
jgi:hypothetical protein